MQQSKQLNFSFVTPTNAPFLYTNIVLHHSYILWHHLHHPQGITHLDLKTY